jgi:hypothetical protein
MKNARQTLMDMNINGAVVSVIIERERDGDVEVLLQTRWKPDHDPVYSGTLEIPAWHRVLRKHLYRGQARGVGRDWPESDQFR